MQDRAEAFRQQVSQLNAESHHRRRYSPELRAEALSYFELRRQQGALKEAVCEELGLSKATLDRWRRRQGSNSETGSRFVRVETASTRGGLVFEALSGYRVCGLALADAIQLLERFS